MESKFFLPVRGINTSNDLDNFKKSETFAEITGFVKASAASVVGKRNSDEVHVSPTISKVVAFMDHLYDLVAEIPPLKQPMRFGNRAFKIFHSRLCEESPAFVADLLPTELSGANFEVSSYLNSAFGNETRIDYGTGHELSFAVFLLCLYKLKVIGRNDLPAVVLKGFTAYLRVMRRVNQEYLLEPAGSHGVWGLDDYHCLVFVWGAAQLIGHPDIFPKSIHDNEVLRDEDGDYIYLSGIQFIKKIKKGASFSETSPMLSDISGMGDWARVYNGLTRMFEGEVLSKLPVVQHLLFGSIILCTWGAKESGSGVGSGVGDKGGCMESKEVSADSSLLSLSASALEDSDS